MTTPTCSQQNIPLLHLVNTAAQTNPRLSFPMMVPPTAVPRWSSGSAAPIMPSTPNLFLQQMYGTQMQPPRLQYPQQVDLLWGMLNTIAQGSGPTIATEA
ncbi:hypothetical protein RB195_009853 [Necator americanus]|uniref:Uncharacterized protein n=1 Tax=Necator americanus TaxID=51031 RepID=A0ABR1CX39_NECAM